MKEGTYFLRDVIRVLKLRLARTLSIDIGADIIINDAWQECQIGRSQPGRQRKLSISPTIATTHVGYIFQRCRIENSYRNHLTQYKNACNKYEVVYGFSGHESCDPRLALHMQSKMSTCEQEKKKTKTQERCSLVTTMDRRTVGRWGVRFAHSPASSCVGLKKHALSDRYARAYNIELVLLNLAAELAGLLLCSMALNGTVIDLRAVPCRAVRVV